MTSQFSPQPRYRQSHPRRTWAKVATAALSGRTTHSEEDVAALEKRVAELMGIDHGICVSQGRTGIYLALCHLIEPGQNVVLSPYTFHEVINMVLCAGGRPIFADIEADSYSIAASEVERLIDNDTGAVIATHLFGISCDIESISKICRDRGVPLIEDAAQCFGARINGRHLGTFGDAAVFSFSRVKNVSSLYGGMVVTQDDALQNHIRSALKPLPYESPTRLLGQALTSVAFDVMTADVLFQFVSFPLFRIDYLRNFNALGRLVETERGPVAYRQIPKQYLKRMTPLQARLVAEQLADVDRCSQARVAHARSYHSGLSDISDIRLPPLREDGADIYLSLPVQVPDCEKLVKHMMRQGRDVRTRQYANAADLPCFAEFARECPNARTAAECGFLLPTYPRYPESEVEKNIRVMREFFGRATDT